MSRVAYWRDGRLEVREGSWAEMPTAGVVWVEVERGQYRHRMQGYDHYWTDGERFGCWNDADSRFGTGYAGQRWECDWERTYTDRAPPDVHTLHGVMLPDKDAREIGIL